MTKPFDGNGPTVREVLDRGLRLWNSDGVRSVRSFFDSALDISEVFLADRKNPLTVARSLGSIVSTSIELYDDVREQETDSPTWREYLAISKQGRLVIRDYAASVILPQLDQTRMVIRSRDELPSMEVPGNQETVLYSYDVEEDEDLRLYWIDNGIECTNIVCKNPDNLERILDALRAEIWDGYHGHIEVSFSEHQDIEFYEKSDLPWRYEGDQGRRLIDRWKKFFDAGTRRAVILHGPPGTGKSTLAQQAARELEGRVLFVPVRILVQLRNLKYFNYIVSILQPDILIADDVDRLSSSDLDLLLSFFEETENPVPLLIATTNHLNRLPGAIKRPGRFDEIWRMSPPGDNIRDRVISYLAELEGADLDEVTLKRISDIGRDKDLPGAHIREIIRRVAVLGVGELDFEEDDLTFSPDWIEEDEFDPSVPLNSDPVEYYEYDDDDEFCDDFMEEFEGYLNDEAFHGSTLAIKSSGFTTWDEVKNQFDNDDDEKKGD